MFRLILNDKFHIPVAGDVSCRNSIYTYEE